MFKGFVAGDWGITLSSYMWRSVGSSVMYGSIWHIQGSLICIVITGQLATKSY